MGNNEGMNYRPLADRLADLVVFAPLGLALMAAERVPELAATGRRAIQSQLGTARMVGELAVRQATRVGEQLVQKGRTVGWSPRHEQASAPGHEAPDSGSPPLTPEAPALAAQAPDLAQASPPAAPSSESAGALAIPGYDTLSAFQVVQRLEGLSQPELEEVRRHEQAGRRRQTVLNRIAQLSAAS